jgi:putative addiction module component (TIGR02574 family)
MRLRGTHVNPTATLETIRTWPVADQLDLVFQLWDRIIDAGWQPTPTPELLAELDRRLAAHEANPGRVLTWEQVVAHVRRAR